MDFPVNSLQPSRLREAWNSEGLIEEITAGMVTMIEPREVVGHFEAREVVSGAPTDILYVWAWSLFLFQSR